jgi:hypothetical protein
MEHIPVILAHGGRGGAVGLVIVAGFVVLILALVCLDRSESASKKD